MTEQENSTMDETFAKLVQKAKKKLTRKTEEEEAKVAPSLLKPDYQFVKSKRVEEDKAFAKRVKEMLTKDPGTYTPIGNLMDKEYFASLNDDQKARYVLTLSKRYNKVLETLK